MWSSGISFFHLTGFNFVACSFRNSFLLLYNIMLYEYIPIYFSISVLMGIWVVSSVGVNILVHVSCLPVQEFLFGV